MLPRHLKAKLKEEKKNEQKILPITDYDFVEDAMYALERDCTQTAEILRRKMPKPKRMFCKSKIILNKPTSPTLPSDPPSDGSRVSSAYDTETGRFPIRRAGAGSVR